MFKKGPIDGVVIRPFRKHLDDRGWLAELFRQDEIDPKLYPVMTYASMTRPGICRGPHEHVEQADYFCFFGPSTFKIVLWDNRKRCPTFQNRMVVYAGEDNPALVIVPEGVVHAYKNVGGKDGLVINCPNRLFMGEERKKPIDEIRHEGDPNTPFNVDF